MIPAIRLTFQNQSNDTTSPKIFFYQRNIAAPVGESPVAWHVIENCGPGDTHAFSFPLPLGVAALDTWNNLTPQREALPGQAFEIARDMSGDVLRPFGNATMSTKIQVHNNVMQGAFSANVYRAGKLLARKPGLLPGDMATFEFRPTIGVGAASQIVEGEPIRADVLAQPRQEFSLQGIASATITMHGGGAGPAARPLTFTLDNVVFG